jgi:hypothetical protein
VLDARRGNDNDEFDVSSSAGSNNAYHTGANSNSRVHRLWWRWIWWSGSGWNILTWQNFQNNIVKRCIYIFIAVTAAFLPLVAFAQVPISVSIPGSNSNVGPAGASGPGDYIGNFYQFALLIGGVLALAVVVYGGILYMTSIGNPSGQSEAKAWLWAAVWGILLLGGAYLILNIINPQLTNLTLPTLQNTGKTSNQVTVPATTGSNGGGTGGSGGGTAPAPGSLGQGMSAADAKAALNAAGVSIKTGPNAANVAGMLPITVSDIDNLAMACAASNGGSSCGVMITEGTGAHAAGTAHALGEKADISSQSAALNNFIMSLGPPVGSRQEGSPPATVNYYAYGAGTIADERNVPGVGAHWDLSAVPWAH